VPQDFRSAVTDYLEQRTDRSGLKFFVGHTHCRHAADAIRDGRIECVNAERTGERRIPIALISPNEGLPGDPRAYFKRPPRTGLSLRHNY